jgi:hypothetical protein
VVVNLRRPSHVGFGGGALTWLSDKEVDKVSNPWSKIQQLRTTKPVFSRMTTMPLFNRFYTPDVDLETLEVVPNVLLSTPMGMRLPLR